MAINFVPLDKNKHKDVKVAVDLSFSFAKNSHLAAASVRELAQLSASMPIVFIQDPKSQNYHLVAMLGTQQEQNLFLQGDRWEGSHVPMNLLRYPFDIRPEGEVVSVYIDEESELLKKEDGNALFTEEGELSEFMENRQKFLMDLANSEYATRRFVDRVVEMGLLDPIQINIAHEDGTRRSVTGMFGINEQRLMQIDESKVAELHKTGFFGAAYSVLLSFGQLNRLVELSKKGDNPIQSMQLALANSEAEQQAQTEA